MSTHFKAVASVSVQSLRAAAHALSRGGHFLRVFLEEGGPLRLVATNYARVQWTQVDISPERAECYATLDFGCLTADLVRAVRSARGERGIRGLFMHLFRSESEPHVFEWGFEDGAWRHIRVRTCDFTERQFYINSDVARTCVVSSEHFAAVARALWRESVLVASFAAPGKMLCQAPARSGKHFYQFPLLEAAGDELFDRSVVLRRGDFCGARAFFERAGRVAFHQISDGSAVAEAERRGVRVAVSLVSYEAAFE